MKDQFDRQHESLETVTQFDMNLMAPAAASKEPLLPVQNHGILALLDVNAEFLSSMYSWNSHEQ